MSIRFSRGPQKAEAQSHMVIELLALNKMKVPLTFQALATLLSLQTFYNTRPLSCNFYVSYIGKRKEKHLGEFKVHPLDLKVQGVKAAPGGVLYVWKVKSFYWSMEVHIPHRHSKRKREINMKTIINSFWPLGTFLVSLKRVIQMLRVQNTLTVRPAASIERESLSFWVVFFKAHFYL